MSKYPNLAGSDFISLDIETRDHELLKRGPGVYLDRAENYICGIAVNNGTHKEYYDIGHLDGNPEQQAYNLEYLKNELRAPCPIIGTNLMYDLDWLINGYDFVIPGPFIDIQIAEPLLDEYARGKYNLNSLAEKYLGEHKQNDELLLFCEKQGWKTTPKKGGREHIWRMPYKVVRNYALGDVDQPIRIWEKQKIEIEKQDLTTVFNMEMELFPMLLQMRKQGVRMSPRALRKLEKGFLSEIEALEKDVNRLAGGPINVRSPLEMKTLFDKKGWKYTRREPTDKMLADGKTEGNPNFDKKSLGSMTGNPFAEKVLLLKSKKTLVNTFTGPYKDMLIDGRLHCSFLPMASDAGGTVSGRFSGRNPNLQQVPSRGDGAILRTLFLPEENHSWIKIDYSQIEYRIMAHYGRGPGSDDIRAAYNTDPRTDYHEAIRLLAGFPEGKEGRTLAKNLNFGAGYGMGPKSMVDFFGWTPDYAQQIYKTYHSRVPFVRGTLELVGDVAQQRGYIKTIMGRRARLESSKWAYKMFNRLIQGSAADMLKKGMVESYRAGVFDVLKPHLTVHDELDCSMPDTTEGREAVKSLVNIMETCVKLKVPIIADAEIGPNWGKLEDFK